MGLLDDAIREHLDLKRARGGDPAEIERMEREALGPVRREPTIGSTRFEAAGEHTGPAPETGYPDDRDELLAMGYQDSTAPHPHAHHAHPQHGHVDPYFEHDYDEPLAAPAEEPEQPKRRFLRRNRPTSLSGSAPPDPGFHEEPPVDPHALLEHDGLFQHQEPPEHELVEQHQPVEGHEPMEEREPVEGHEPVEQHEAPEQHGVTGEVAQPAIPPHLRFDNPPKRPHFSAEPPSLEPEAAGGAPDAAREQPASAAPPPAPAEPRPARSDEPDDDLGAQETTEFDVQKHIAETRFQPDPEPRAHPDRKAPAPSDPEPPAEHDAPEDEDVLEETPEFLQDTPEHDRLWFEQRPPRDFDFDG